MVLCGPGLDGMRYPGCTAWDGCSLKGAGGFIFAMRYDVVDDTIRVDGQIKVPSPTDGTVDLGTIGLLLDLNIGTLTVFKNGNWLGVMATGLKGEFCWAIQMYNKGDSVRIEPAPEPTAESQAAAAAARLARKARREAAREARRSAEQEIAVARAAESRRRRFLAAATAHGFLYPKDGVRR